MSKYTAITLIFESDGKIYLWAWHRSAAPKELTEHSKVYATSPSGRFLGIVEDSQPVRLKVIDLERNFATAPVTPLIGYHVALHLNPVSPQRSLLEPHSAIAWSPDSSYLVTGGIHGALTIWKVEPTVPKALPSPRPIASPPPAAGLEEVRFYDGLTDSRTGAMAPDETILGGHAQSGQRRAVVSLPAAENLGMSRVFLGPGLSGMDWEGVEGVRLPADPAQARQFLVEAGLEETDLILLDIETVPAGLEQSWRPATSRTPILVIPASGLEELTPHELSAMAQIVRNLSGQVLRVGLEELSRRSISEDSFFSIQY